MAGKISHELDYLSAQEQLEHEIDYAEWNASLEGLDTSGELVTDEWEFPEEYDEYLSF